MGQIKGQIIRDQKILRTSEAMYINEKEFFIALVTICDRLGIEVPLWTSFEERKLNTESEVLIEIDNDSFLRIYKS